MMGTTRKMDIIYIVLTITIIVLPVGSGYIICSVSSTPDHAGGDEDIFHESSERSWYHNGFMPQRSGYINDYDNEESQFKHSGRFHHYTPNHIHVAAHGIGKEKVKDNTIVIPYTDIEIILNWKDVINEDTAGTGYYLFNMMETGKEAYTYVYVNNLNEKNARKSYGAQHYLELTFPGSLMVNVACLSGYTPTNPDHSLHKNFRGRGVDTYIGFKTSHYLTKTDRFADRFWGRIIHEEYDTLDAMRSARSHANEHSNWDPKGKMKPVIASRTANDNGRAASSKNLVPMKFQYRTVQEEYDSVPQHLSEQHSLRNELTIQPHPGFRDFCTYINLEGVRVVDDATMKVRFEVSIDYDDETPDLNLYYPGDEQSDKWYLVTSDSQDPYFAIYGTSTIVIRIPPNKTKAGATITVDVFAKDGEMRRVTHFDILHQITEI